MNKTFENKIEPLINVIKNICAEEDIDFLVRFNLPDDSQYFGTEGNYIMDSGDLFTQIQLWEMKHNMKFIKDNDEKVSVLKVEIDILKDVIRTLVKHEQSTSNK